MNKSDIVWDSCCLSGSLPDSGDDTQPQTHTQNNFLTLFFFQPLNGDFIESEHLEQ